MKVVVDTSIIIAVILNESSKTKIVEVTKGQELIAPNSLQWEIGNAFSAMFKRKKITLEQAIIGFEIFQKIPLEYPPIDFSHALNISHKNGIYAYDAYFLTLSQKHRCPFITLDNSLKDIALKIGIKIIEVNDDYL